MEPIFLSRLLTMGRQIAAIASALLITSASFASVRCVDIFSSPKTVSQSEAATGARFLIQKNSQLHTSPMVEKAARREGFQRGIRLSKPADKVMAWIRYLESIASKAQSDPRLLKTVYEAFYRKYVIKPEDVPESFFELQKRIARERGQGESEITPEQKRQWIDRIITDQKRSLDAWIDYLLSPDTSVYPMWVKYWILTGMVKLSKFHPDDGTFGHRTKGTVAPFPELNREALAYVVDALVKHVEGRDLSSIQDPELIGLLPGSHFGKMYAHALKKAGVGGEKRFITNEGQWVVFKEGSDHRPLVKSLEGQNTGWCTAAEGTAKGQLALGDFHVYYSLDAEGRPTVPRVAIRMEGHSIVEVRGVGKDQNLDPQISQSGIVAGKLKEFGPEGEKYLKKEAHMKRLTSIEHKDRLNQELSKDDLAFLYEVNERIEGFGYERDPRIDEIKSRRNVRTDLVRLLDEKYREDEISLTTDEMLREKTKVHYGNLELKQFLSAKDLHLPEVVIGDLNLSGLKSAEGLKLPGKITGDLELWGLESPKGLELPERIGGSLFFFRLRSTKGLKLPKEIGGSLHLRQLRSLKGVEFPEKIGGDLILSEVESAEDLKFPKEVGGSLHLDNLQSAKKVEFPERIGGFLNLEKLTSAEDLKLPEEAGDNVYLSRLESAKNFELPKRIGGDLWLSSLKSVEDLKLPDPDKIGGYLVLSQYDRKKAAELKEKNYKIKR